MTEAEWLTCDNPARMFLCQRAMASHRKLRLFAVACWLGPFSPVYEERCRRLIDLAERYADGQAGEAELAAARRMGYPEGLITLISPDAAEAAFLVISSSTADVRPKAQQPAVFRCIMGNPFRRACPHPGWLTPSVKAIAQRVYDERDFALLGHLADALGGAGCTEQQLLEHCREAGQHWRGCFVVDLVLGKP
jgi:hypothetical protein